MFGRLGILRIYLTWNIFNPRWVYPFIVSVQLLSRVRLFSTPWTAACQASLSFTSSWSLLNSTPLSQWCYPTNSSSVIPFSLLPSVFPSIRVFSNESALRIRWPNYWSFSFSISPSDEYSGLISFQSVQFSHSVMSDSLWPHELQHTRAPCPSLTPGVYPNLCPLSQWCHPAISSSVVPFSSCPQSLQHQSLFQWVSSSHEVAKVLEFQL